MQPRRKILILIGICLGVAIGAMIFSEINTALATIKKDLSASVVQLQWVMNIFGIAICSTLVIFGRLADVFGRKRLYLIGILGLGISMLGSGLAPSAGWIIFFQIILGLAGAILIPVSQALISTVYPENERSRAIGIWAAVIGLAMAAGPLLSGGIVSLLSWRWVFLLNIPFILASLILVVVYAPESKSDEHKPSIDFTGAFFLTIAISCFVLAVIQGHAWPLSLVAGLYLLSAIALIILLYVEKRAVMPIIREDLFTHRMFLTASLANFCLIFFVWAGFFLIPLYLQTIHHYLPFQAGLMLLFVTIPLAIFSFSGGFLHKIVQPKKLIVVGFIFLFISAVMQMYFQANTSFIMLMIGIAAFGIGWGLIWGPTTTAAISTLSLKEAGIASGSFVTIQEIGGTVGLAITVSVVNMHPDLLVGYHNGMWVLVAVSVIGLLATLLMKKPVK